MKKINDLYYKGFEGEPELKIYSRDYELVIWEGYFDFILKTILDSCGSDIDKINNDLLRSYFYADNNWDSIPWKINDVNSIISTLEIFKKCPNSNIMYSESLNVVNVILEFISNFSSKDIYIERD